MGTGSFSIWVFLLALATTLGFQVLSNFANDYGDGIKGTDNRERIGPPRAMQSGLLTAGQLKKGIFVTAVLTLVLSCLLIYVAFKKENFALSFIFFLLGIAAIVSAVTYTVGKRAYGYRALGDLFVFIFFGLVGVMGSFFLYTQTLKGPVFLLAITIGFLSAAVLNLNNMRDRAADANAYKNTLVVVLGEANAKKYHYLLVGLAFLSAAVFIFSHSQDFFDLVPMVAFVPLGFHLMIVYKNTAPALLDPELKKVALSTFLFSILFFASQFF